MSKYGTTEGDIMRLIQQDLSHGDVRLYRANNGEAWQGVTVARTTDSLTLKHPRRVNFGLAPGSGDLIGYRRTVITQEMVGKTLAVFASIEVKRPDTIRRTTAEQKNFIAHVNQFGGISGVACDTLSAKFILDSIQ